MDPIVLEGLDYIDDPDVKVGFFGRTGHSKGNFCELLRTCPKWFLKGKQLRRGGTFTRYLWEASKTQKGSDMGIVAGYRFEALMDMDMHLTCIHIYDIGIVFSCGPYHS